MANCKKWAPRTQKYVSSLINLIELESESKKLYGRGFLMGGYTEDEKYRRFTALWWKRWRKNRKPEPGKRGRRWPKDKALRNGKFLDLDPQIIRWRRKVALIREREKKQRQKDMSKISHQLFFTEKKK